MTQLLAAFDRDVLLATGRSIHIRASQASDLDPLRDFYDGLSDESMYRRFCHARPKVVLDRLQPLDAQSADTRVVLLALEGDTVVGTGELWRVPCRPEAEVAFAVADSHQHEGIATLLLEDLALIGRTAGLQRLTAETLVDNEPMLQVFRSVGLTHRVWYQDGRVHVELDLAGAEQLEDEAASREWQAAVASLRPLLAPEHVVVIGAGRSPSSPGRIVLDNLLMHFRGQVSVVHPSAATSQGLPAVAAVGDLGAVPDLAVIAVPAAQVHDVVEDCGRFGVRAAVIISAGFAETGADGVALQADVLTAARRHGMRIIGPNCLGVVSTAIGLNATFMHRTLEAGPVAIASQSGGVGIVLAAEAARRHLGVSSFVSLGNKADVSGNDLLRYWADDPDTHVVMMYLESIGDPQRFARIARAVSMRVPVVALKSGRSEAGKRGARSHTAALATDDTAVDALFARTGVVRADTLDELLDVATLLAQQPAPRGRRVALIGNAGGPLILAADAAASEGLDVVELSEGLQARLRELVPDAAATANPVDLLATVTSGSVHSVMKEVAASGEVDACALVTVNLDGSEREPLTLQLDWSDPTVPAVAVLLGGLDGVGAMPAYSTPERAMTALARAAARGEWLEDVAAARSTVPAVDPLEIRRLAHELLDGDEHDGWLPPEQAFRLLEAVGVPVAPWAIATTTEECVEAARRLGFPCVLKADVEGVVHKSDDGAVALDVWSPSAVMRAADGFRARFGDRLRHVLVQRQADAGVEVLVGAVRDPAIGPLLVVAAGGVQAEILADREVLLAPVSHTDAKRAIDALRMAPLLRGFRGAAIVPTEPLADLAVRVAALVATVPEISELDLNPVIGTSAGWCVVDARVAVAPRTVEPLRALRRPAR